MLDGPALDGRTDPVAQIDAMRGRGVGFVRFPIYWAQSEPSPGVLDLAAVDRLVLAAARDGIAVAPTVLGTPGWAAAVPALGLAAAPADPARFAAFLTVLAERYGPSGSLWREHPDVAAAPIRRWEVWNEPNLEVFWAPHEGWPAAYTALLRPAYAALHAVDPGATVIAAGLPVKGWRALRALYEAGAGRFFDVAALHPYTNRPTGVLRILRLARAAMDDFGDRAKPLAVTEMTWASSAGHRTRTYGWETTEPGQAARIREALPLLAAARRALGLDSIAWYTWISPPFGTTKNSFGYSGLLRLTAAGRVVRKPSLSAWQQTVAKLTR